jgi:ABC-type glycerol-3-phosphate transport system substrate-binding protein
MNIGLGSLPTQQSVIDHKAYQEYVSANPLVKPFLESLKTDVIVQPRSGQFSAIVTTVAKYLGEAMYLKSTPQEALDKANAEIEKLMTK